jgi:hypothetical protein
MRCRRQSGAVRLLAVVSLLLASCTGDRSRASIPSSSAVPTSDAPADVDATTLVSAGVLYIFVDPSHRIAIQNGLEVAISECMEQAGFDYVPRTRTQSPEFEVAEARQTVLQHIGAFDQALASELGYGLRDYTVSPADGSGPLDDSTEYRRALYGDDADSPTMVDLVDPLSGQKIGQAEVRAGCVGQADDAVYGDANLRVRYSALDISLQQVGSESIRSALADAETQKRMQQWKECMNVAGYEVDDVLDPLNQRWPDPPGEAEILMATTDVGCKESTSLIDSFLQALARSVSELDDQSSAALEEWNELAAGILARIT